jgi:hypothetical protein
MDVENEPLEDVLASVCEQTGYDFIIHPAVKKRPVTILVERIMMDDGLSRILKAAGIGSHALVYGLRKRVTIVITGEMRTVADVGASVAVNDSGNSKATKTALLEDSQAAVPSEEVFARHHKSTGSSEVPSPPVRLNHPFDKRDSAVTDTGPVQPPPDSVFHMYRQLDTSPIN